MQASFGWDVGPSFPSTGIWRSLSVQAYNAANIQYIKFNTDLNKEEEVKKKEFYMSAFNF